MSQLDNLFELSRDILKDQTAARRQITAKATFMIGFAGTVLTWGIPEMGRSSCFIEHAAFIITYILLIACILCGLWVILPRRYYAGDSLRQGMKHATATHGNSQQAVTAWVFDSNVNAIEANRPIIGRMATVLAFGIGCLVAATVITAVLRIVNFQ